jgi:hypothetical protein
MRWWLYPGIDRRLLAKLMKRTIKLLALTGLFAVFAAPAFAQTKECTEEFKSATYQKWYDNRKGDQDAAYQAAKDYLATCTTEDQYSKALKNFVNEYDRVHAATKTNNDFQAAYEKKNYAEQLRLGKQIVASDPEKTSVYIVMGLTGLGDPALLNESSQYAKKAIEMLEAGKPFAPYKTKDEPLAYLTYVVGKASPKSDAIPYFLKAAKFDSDLKKDWRLYYDLASAYGEGPRAKLTEEYKAKTPNGTETPESKLVLANLNPIIDRQIDALARAAALADATNKKPIMDELTDLYKYRNKSETGLNELVASVLSKPLPDVPIPLTALPTPAPGSTPATSGPGTNGTPPTGTTGGAKTTGTNGGATTGQKTTGSVTVGGTGTAKPVASPTPSNKKPRSNFRRG